MTSPVVLVAQAERRARAVIADETAPAQARANAQNFLDDALDAQNKTAEAFAAYDVANAGLKAIFRERFETPGEETGSELINRWKREFESTADQAWIPDPEDAPSPAFVLSFPRSGTTLLGQILASHTQISTL